FLKGLARRHRDGGPYDHGFDVAHTTVHTGVIRGGIALNIVPDGCVFDFEFRYLPGDEADALLTEFKHYLTTRHESDMLSLDPQAGFTITPLTLLPPLSNSAEAAVVALAQELSGNHELGKVSFGTEAAHFQKARIPAVVCGPGSIAQAHKADEYVTIDQIALC